MNYRGFPLNLNVGLTNNKLSINTIKIKYFVFDLLKTFALFTKRKIHKDVRLVLGIHIFCVVWQIIKCAGVIIYIQDAKRNLFI